MLAWCCRGFRFIKASCSFSEVQPSTRRGYVEQATTVNIYILFYMSLDHITWHHNIIHCYRCKNVNFHIPLTFTLKYVCLLVRCQQTITEGIPKPVGVQSKQVCGGSIAGTAGLNPTEGMDCRVLGSLCIVQVAASVTTWPLFQMNPCVRAYVRARVCGSNLKISALRLPRLDLLCHWERNYRMKPNYWNLLCSCLKKTLKLVRLQLHTVCYRKNRFQPISEIRRVYV
jgi:hypothetical protein